MPGGWEWVILLVVVVALFGAKRLPEMARSMGRSARVFRGELKGLSEDGEPTTPPTTPPTTVPNAAPPAALPPGPSATSAPATGGSSGAEPSGAGPAASEPAGGRPDRG
ncbi:MAG TPA: Sec-independent protein translocase subunit TatA [Pseudonocardia sp.]